MQGTLAPTLDFNPRSPHGERPHQYAFAGDLQNFNPRSPHGERPHWDRPKTSAKDISTHAPRTGSDALGSPENKRKRHFNPRSPHGERRRFDCTGRNYGRYFNPRSPHGERLGRSRNMSDRKEISTHAPRTGSDCIFGQQRCCHKHISTHAPRTGSDGQCRRRVKGIDDFNPRSPHGERPRYCPSRPCLDRISTHAPRTGSDEMSSSYHASSSIFQPTLPARGATLIPTLHTPAVKISTHAPRTGSDSPHGERRPMPPTCQGHR